MVIADSSQAIASNGIKHRAGEKPKTDDYEKNIEHGNLVIPGYPCRCARQGPYSEMHDRIHRADQRRVLRAGIEGLAAD